MEAQGIFTLPVNAVCLAKILQMGKEAGESNVEGLDRRFPPVGLMRRFFDIVAQFLEEASSRRRARVFDQGLTGYVDQLGTFLRCGSPHLFCVVFPL